MFPTSIPTIHLMLLCGVLVMAKLSLRSNASPSPWDWQAEEQVNYAKYNQYEEEMEKMFEQVDYAKYNKYEKEMEKMLEQPYFARVNNKTEVKRGEPAFLPCRVKEMGEGYTVTWMRLSDVTILSVGSMAYSSDQRYGLVLINRPRITADDWTLVINTTSTMDSGKYECSVNTLPKITHVVELVVEDPMDIIMQDSPYTKSTKTPLTKAENVMTLPEEDDHPLAIAVISGPSTHHVSSGSTVGLECRLSHLSTPPTSLYWKKEGKVFSARDRPGISLESEKVPGDSTTRLFISHVTTDDSGQYSCCSDITTPDTVRLVVTEVSPGSALTGRNSSLQAASCHELHVVTALLAVLAAFSNVQFI